ncbi:STAS domain-containing protein [Streptomyces spiramenti]|uniref:STAS domain-containing protein n=1 Tax=Streptomyces spiramenti TaxID=2720606 RepID=A0ABX1AHY5_9ACTN|nr:STAS domain-containing protein [Streptomyces spiramenti]
MSLPAPAGSTTDVARLPFDGELDMDSVPGVRARAAELRASGASRLVLDVRRVTFADSTAVNLLLQLRQNGPFTLRGPLPEQLFRLLDLTGTLPMFEIDEHGSTDTA